MAENEVDIEKEVFSLVFDPYTDFKTAHSTLSPEISYLDFARENKNLKTKNKIKIDDTKYTINEEPSSWQLIKSISNILHPKPRSTETYHIKDLSHNPIATLAEVHRFKFPSHYVRSNPHTLVSCPTNSAVVTSHLIGDLVTSSQQPRDVRFARNELLGKFLAYRDASAFGISREDAMDGSNSCQPLIQPTIHTFPIHQPQFTQNKMDSNKCYASDNRLKLLSLQGNSKPHLIIVPHGDQTGHQHEIIREVYRYPPGSIETVVEKKPFLTDRKSSADRPTNRTTENVNRKTRNASKKKKLHASQSSIESSSSVVSGKSLSSLLSQTDSALSGDSISNVSESSFLKPNTHIPYMNGPFVHKFNDKCEPDLLSDSSSNISTMSDLSGYEDEYTNIRRLVSDGAASKLMIKRSALNASDSVGKKSYMETKIQEQENTIKSLHSYKEDLEIQVHRLSVQLQNAVREKELCQEQLDMMQTKLTEKNQQQYFELLKEKVSLEGQYETLKQEFHHCSTSNSELAAKLHQSKIEAENYDKERLKLLSNETEFGDKLINFEKENLKLENELKAVNEILALEINNCLSLRTEMREKENYVADVQFQIETHAQHSDNYEETIQNLKKWNLEYSEREEQQRLEKRKIENLLSESAAKFNTLKENSEWFQTQLNKAQKLQADLQNELGETKSTLTIVSSDRDRCKREADRLNSEIEDNRAKAVRDKSLLLVQLEELEADMREREAMIRQLEEGDKVTQVKMSEDRFKRLEEDHKRLQELKIEFRDVLRHSDSLKDELKHKSLMLRRHEEAIHDLRKDLAVSQEELGSKQVSIDSLTDKLNTTKLKLERTVSQTKENDVTITNLKEHNLKLEATLLTAEEDKKQVNETVARLKEDMSKLSSNFFRMKHDLSAKDKQINILSTQNSELNQTEKELLSKCEHLSKQLKEFEEGKKHQNEITSLKESLKKSNSENMKVKEEVSQFKKSFESFEVEKKSLTNSVHLRDEQIENMQGVIDTYKEKILQKDEEIFTRKDHLSKVEKNHSDLQKRFNFLNNEYQMNLQEREEFQELEINYKNSITELKESIKFEKKSKENHDKNYKEAMVELANTKKLLKEKTDVAETAKQMKTELENEKKQLKLREEEIENIKYELEIRTTDILKLKNEIVDLNIKLDESKKASEDVFKQSLKLKEEEVSKLDEALSLKKLEVNRLQSIVSEKEEKEKETNIKLNSMRHHANADRNIVKLNAKKAAKNHNKKEEEFGHLKQRLRESTNKWSRQTKEIETLKKLTDDYENEKTTLSSTIEEMKRKFEAVKEENETLKNLRTTLQEEVQNNHSLLLVKGKECDDWKQKYDNLIDTIPQRDTNTHTVDNVGQMQVASEYQNCSRLSDVLCAEESIVQNFNLEEKLKFTETMTYLQKQISLTAEALQNKDRQIIELNEILINTIPSASASNNSLEKISSVIDEQEYLGASDIQTCSGTNSFRTLAAKPEIKRATSYTDASTSTIEESETSTKYLEEKEESAKLVAELQVSLSVKESEFKEKQRRYESNLRLLTRKLKEHMKGRRATEKELDMSMQGSKQDLEEEQKRYQVLKTRCLDLEKKCQDLESDLASCEGSRLEGEAALRSVEDDLQKERNTILQMQKEIGHTEELKHYLENLRSKVKTLNEDIMNKSKGLDEAGEALQSSLKEREALEHKQRSMTSQVDELVHRLTEEEAKVTEREKSLKSEEQEVTKKTEDISNLQETIRTLQLKCNNLDESLQRIQTEDANNCKKIATLSEDVESLKSCVDLKNTLIDDLNAKTVILEKELQLKEECVECLKAESESLSLRLIEVREKSDASAAVLERRVGAAKEAETNLSRRLASVHKDKMAYQAQATQLRIALNSALAKLQTSSALSSLPSPSPLNTESLTQLLEQCSKPPPSNTRIANSLSERLNSLREEVSVLQSEIKDRDQQGQ